MDEELQKVDFTSNKFHIVLHFKRKELELIWEVSCECYVVENANKIIETEQCFTCPLSPPILRWQAYTRNEAVTWPKSISILIGGLKIATAN